jgi:copper chaperone CopZ
MSETTYTVTGMTCAHCVGAVTGELTKLAGVADVAIDLASGRVTVQGAGFTDAQVAEAVDEAGYSVADA